MVGEGTALLSSPSSSARHDIELVEQPCWKDWLMSVRRGLSATLVDMPRPDPESLVASDDAVPIAQQPTQYVSVRTRIFQALAVSTYLITWVANSEFLQGISNGKLCPDNIPYDKPAFITWCSYNYMLLSALVVYPYVRWRRKCSMKHYLINIWAGRLGFRRAVGFCAMISLALQLLNIFYILALECISVSLSNATFQLQTAFTVGLSSCLLREKMDVAAKIGVFIATMGVAAVVLPPIFRNEGMASISQCSSQSSPVSFGVLATVASAAIGGAYLVSWRVLDEKRDVDATTVPTKKRESSRLSGFIDTHVTLFMIGFCNLTIGWPIIPCLHWLGLERIDLPPTPGHWAMLHWNGVIEYSFDASCAAAIYFTSPVVTAIVAPITIPLSLVADGWIYGTVESSSQGWMLFGSGVILIGIWIMEAKPQKLDQLLGGIVSIYNKKAGHDDNDDNLGEYEVPKLV